MARVMHQFMFKFAVFFVTIFATVIMASLAKSAVEIEVEVGKVTCWQGQENVIIPVYLRNYSDYVFSFNLWFQFDQPDIASFVIDSLDTTGTLLGQWPGYSLTELGGADIAASSMLIAPQDGTIPLFKILAHANHIPDTLSDRKADILINWQFMDHFFFMAPNGHLMGTVSESVIDTSYFNCLQWVGEICLQYGQVPGPPADSIFVDTFSITKVDTALTRIINGSITIRPCGDANNDNKTNLLDISFIINYLYRQGPAPNPIQAADVDKNGTTNLLDVSAIINFLYRGGEPLGCPDAL
jgi:hypothetical protein